MNKVSFNVNIICIFFYFSRNTFYGGEKFLHRKAVFFCQELLQLLKKTHQTSTPIRQHVLHVTLKYFN